MTSDVLDVDGLPSTTEPKVELFLRTAFDQRTGELTVPRTGRIWEAIETAHSVGSRGDGKVIAIVDIGFDATMLPADRVHPGSKISPWVPHPNRGRHGTAVALIALAAAPEARLLLIDVREGERFGALKTAAAIATAVQHGAAVTNISAEFETDCEPRDWGQLDVDAITRADPDPEGFLREVERWLEFAEPYADARCRRACRVCDAIIAAADSTVLIAAAGNRYPASCPACTAGSVGIGFQRTMLLEIDGDVSIVRLPTVTEHGDVTNPEMVVDEPEGFDGTSFASPLFAGLTSLLPDRRDAALLAGVMRAATPLLNMAIHWRANLGQAPARAGQTLVRGFERFAENIPASHQHWLAAEPEPCALCALVLIDWYDTYASVLWLRRATDDALTWATTAAAVAPFSATSAANAGMAWELSAAGRNGAERADALRRAELELGRAVEMEPDIEVYRFMLDRVRSAEV
jgi:hypothetical protein